MEIALFRTTNPVNTAGGLIVKPGGQLEGWVGKAIQLLLKAAPCSGVKCCFFSLFLCFPSLLSFPFHPPPPFKTATTCLTSSFLNNKGRKDRGMWSNWEMGSKLLLLNQGAWELVRGNYFKRISLFVFLIRATIDFLIIIIKQVGICSV